MFVNWVGFAINYTKFVTFIAFFQLFSKKPAKDDYFDQHLGCAKYTTHNPIGMGHFSQKIVFNYQNVIKSNPKFYSVSFMSGY